MSNKRGIDRRRVGLSVLALLLLQTASGETGAQTAPGQTAERLPPVSGQDFIEENELSGLEKQALEPVSGQEDQVRRLIVLIPSRLETTTPQAQHGAEQAAAKILSARKPRGKRRKRLFTLPGTSRESVPPAPAPPVFRTEKADSDPKSGQRSEKAAEKSLGKTADKTPKDKRSSAVKSGGKAAADSSAKSKPPDTVPVEQRAILAQALFADVLAERIQERLGVAVAAQTEVSAALSALRLTPAAIEDRDKPENGRRLCAYLHCQAILIPHILQCKVKDGLTRDITCYARVTIEKIGKTEKNETPVDNPKGKLAGKRPDGTHRKAETNGEGQQDPEGVSAARWPARLDVAGAASASQVLFHRQYQKPQGDLIRDAAQQAASLLAHTLRTGEQAPFMRPADRLAVLPIPAPTQADKLVFTKLGRRVQPLAVQRLNGNVSALFTPDLLPLSSDHILDASEVMARVELAYEQSGSVQEKNSENLRNLKSLENLWKHGKDEMAPDTGRVQFLGRRLGTDYVLLARITDIEVSEGAADPATLVSNITPGEPERAVRVEAVAALVRVVDGTVQWQDRATATVTSPLTAQSAAGSASAERSLVHDTIRFALMELERRLRHYRTGFEK